MEPRSSRVRYFENPYPDYGGQEIDQNRAQIVDLITQYVRAILENTAPFVNPDRRGDLYVGDAGIAYMFLCLSESPHTPKNLMALENAEIYIKNAKQNCQKYLNRRHESCSFLCGNAGIYAVAAVISKKLNKSAELQSDLEVFLKGFASCGSSTNVSDEVLVGRAGFLSGIYWINKNIKPEPIDGKQILFVCKNMLESGREYSQKNSSKIPLMYQYHGSEYLGAAHGVCAILHMMLESPWFIKDEEDKFSSIAAADLADIKNSIDAFLSLQEADGNFPVSLNSERSEKRLVHWCHGAPGSVYLLAKAYRLFKDERYLLACKRAADLVWQKGLLYKGPGICHGIAGSGYVFLILFKLTGDNLYLYRAHKFMEFLQTEDFRHCLGTPDRPFSLYEGLAGTVCFLIDLMEPENASFPFMNVT